MEHPVCDACHDVTQAGHNLLITRHQAAAGNTTIGQSIAINCVHPWHYCNAVTHNVTIKSVFPEYLEDMNSSSIVIVTKAFVAGRGESALVLGTGQGSHLELRIVICNNYLGSAKHLYQDMSYFYNTAF